MRPVLPALGPLKARRLRAVIGPLDRYRSGRAGSRNRGTPGYFAQPARFSFALVAVPFLGLGLGRQPGDIGGLDQAWVLRGAAGVVGGHSCSGQPRGACSAPDALDALSAAASPEESTGGAGGRAHPFRPGSDARRSGRGVLRRPVFRGPGPHDLATLSAYFPAPRQSLTARSGVRQSEALVFIDRPIREFLGAAGLCICRARATLVVYGSEVQRGRKAARPRQGSPVAYVLAFGRRRRPAPTSQLLADGPERGPAAGGMPSGSTGPEFRGVPVTELLSDYQLALFPRYLDDREITLQKQSRCFFHISGAGHEALCLGFARSLRAGYDWFFPYYRDRSLALALGIRPPSPFCRPWEQRRTRPQVAVKCLVISPSRQFNIVTQSSPTGSQAIPAVGCAEGGRYISRHADEDLPGCTAQPDEVVYLSMGEGATSEGEFWESLNTACSLRLPVLYIIADNGYAISVPAAQQSPRPISDLVKGFPISVHRIDGRDYFDVRAKAPAIVAAIRQGMGPALVHATVIRPYSHSSADTQSKYRPQTELDDESWNDPIAVFERALLDGHILSEGDLAERREQARTLVAEAAKEALHRARPGHRGLAFAQAPRGDEGRSIR